MTCRLFGYIDIVKIGMKFTASLPLWGWPHQEIHSVHLFTLTMSPGPQTALRIRVYPMVAAVKRRRESMR